MNLFLHTDILEFLVLMSQKIFKENGEYNIDHSSPVILLKNGKYVARISHRDDIKKSLKIIKKYL